MKQNSNSDFLYQVFSLIISIIIVHAIYVTVVLPTSEALLVEQAARQAAGDKAELPRSIHIVLKDPEQESEIILALWAFAIITLKIRQTMQQRTLLDEPLLEVTPGTTILPEDSRKYARPLQALPPIKQQYLLPRALLAALQRFDTTRSIQDAAAAVREVCDLEADRLDSELSMVRYVIWVIPSIGFLGTVRGIGQALSSAQEAVEGNIIPVTVNLGVAFNSTLVALVVSMVIMFILHQLQLLQERLVIDTQSYCETNLVRHLQVR